MIKLINLWPHGLYKRVLIAFESNFIVLGYPLISVEYSDSGKTVTISQQQFQLIANDSVSAHWVVPLRLQTGTGREFEILLEQVKC